MRHRRASRKGVAASVTAPWLLLLLAAAPLSGAAAEQHPRAAAASAAAPAAAEPLPEELAAIVDHLHDLRFDSAAAEIDRLIKERPEHPAGPFYRSLLTYQRYMIEQPPSEETLRRFEEEIERSLASSRAAAGSSPAVSEYYQGAASGMLARGMLSARRYASALPASRRAARHLEKALELDPSLGDARLGLGMYHYFLARVPAAARPFAYLLMGLRGDARRGLEELEASAAGRGPGRMEARSVLSVIYASKHEKRWDRAEELARELMIRYPRNPLYRLRLVYVLERQARWDEAAALADPASGWLDAIEPAVREPARAAARARLEEIARLKPLGPDGAEQVERPRWPGSGLPR